MLHSAILYWLPLFMCQGDILWMNGKEGGYLVLGNCVYTVSIFGGVAESRATLGFVLCCSTWSLRFVSRQDWLRIHGLYRLTVPSGDR